MNYSKILIKVLYLQNKTIETKLIQTRYGNHQIIFKINIFNQVKLVNAQHLYLQDKTLSIMNGINR